LKAIAVTRSVRSRFAPNVPTVAEAGLDGFDVGAWICLLAPGKTPGLTVARLNADIRRILSLDDVKQQFAQQGVEIDPSTPEQLRSFMTQETAKWSSVLAHSRPTHQ
jgi:tripartite-type tricarboxylate transporter receptor subunit TctC